ncbi:MAG: hypothetical protein ACI8X5_000767 [Planctomycetota bacterium]
MKRVSTVYLLLILIAGGFASQRPTYEWDLLGYLGCVEELAGKNAQETHASVYAQIAEQVPERAAQDLRAKIPYRELLTNNAEAFGAQLRFYRGRIVYIGLLKGLSQLGVPPIRTIYALSLLAGLATAWVLFRWMARHMPPIAAAVCAFGGLAGMGFYKGMTLATPDMLAACFLITGAWCLIEKNRAKLGLVFFVLAIATRSDHIVLIGPLLVWLGATNRISKASLGLALVLVLSTVYVATAGRNTYGWWTVFHHTFFGYKSFPALETPAPDLMLAIKHVGKSLPKFSAFQPAIYVLIALFALVSGYKKNRVRSLSAGLAAVSLFALFVHFALFPALWPRLMLPYWSLGLVAFGLSWKEKAKA